MMKTMLLSLRIILIAALVHQFVLQPINAQYKKLNKKSIVSYPETIYSSLQYRSIGPYRGGRSSAVTGVEGKPNLFYFGAAGGGVWKTEDGGETYENISDGYFGGSIGSISVSKSDNNLSTPFIGSLWAEIYGVKSLGTVKALLHAGSVFASALSPLVFGYIIDWGYGVTTIVTISILIIIVSTLLPIYNKLP